MKPVHERTEPDGTRVTWLLDERTGMFWQMMWSPLTAAQRERMFSPEANMEAAMRYIATRYSKPWATWRPTDDS